MDTVPNITGLKRTITHKYNVDIKIAQGNGNHIIKLHIKWSPIEDIVDT